MIMLMMMMMMMMMMMVVVVVVVVVVVIVVVMVLVMVVVMVLVMVVIMDVMMKEMGMMWLMMTATQNNIDGPTDVMETMFVFVSMLLLPLLFTTRIHVEYLPRKFFRNKSSKPLEVREMWSKDFVILRKFCLVEDFVQQTNNEVHLQTLE